MRRERRSPTQIPTGIVGVPRKLIALRGPCERLQEVTQFFPSRLRRRCASRRRHIVTGRRLNWFRCNCSPKLGSLAHGAPPKVLPLVHFGIKAGSVNCLVTVDATLQANMDGLVTFTWPPPDTAASAMGPLLPPWVREDP